MNPDSSLETAKRMMQSCYNEPHNNKLFNCKATDRAWQHHAFYYPCVCGIDVYLGVLWNKQYIYYCFLSLHS